ncbi:MAG: CBS domain-containing protein [Planctomycetota bacterium]
MTPKGFYPDPLACPGARSTRVEQIMTRGVVALGMDRPVKEAHQHFNDGALHHLLVLERGAVVGVVSDRDVLGWISPFVGKMSEKPRDVALLERPIHQIMSRGVVTIGPSDSIDKAASRLLRHHIGCLPVTTEGGKLVGILTWRDVIRWLAERAGVEAEPGEPIRCSRFESRQGDDADAASSAA